MIAWSWLVMGMRLLGLLACLNGLRHSQVRGWHARLRLEHPGNRHSGAVLFVISFSLCQLETGDTTKGLAMCQVGWPRTARSSRVQSVRAPTPKAMPKLRTAVAIDPRFDILLAPLAASWACCHPSPILHPPAGV